MRLGRGMTALLGGVALLAATAAALPATAATPARAVGALVACDAPAWAEGVTWTAGSRVTYNGRLYQALVTHTPPAGAGWNPAAVPALWTDLGACTGGTPSPSPT
ncbi:glycoside hydrolase family 18, partial [Micromonospora aurantiaca]